MKSKGKRLIYNATQNFTGMIPTSNFQLLVTGNWFRVLGFRVLCSEFCLACGEMSSG